MRIDHPQSITTHRLDGKEEITHCRWKTDPWAPLSEHSYSSRQLNHARHMDPKASSTRDQHAAGCLAGRSDDLRAVGIFGRRGPEGRF